MHAAWAQYDTLFISHACKYACTCKIDDANPTAHSSRVCTKCVHNASVYVRNAHAKFGLRIHENCKPRTAE